MGVLEAIFAAGVVGAGGAGFPTHLKLKAGAELLIVNAAECEPLLASDRYVMRHFAGAVVRALVALREELGIGRVVIGTKAKYAAEIASLRTAIEAAGGGIEIGLVDSFYPAGDEQVLIHELTGRSVPPGGIPLDLGIVVINVTTVYMIAGALEGVPVTRRLVTVNGAVGRPVIVDAPVGTTAADLIAAAGGVAAGGRDGGTAGGPGAGGIGAGARLPGSAAAYKIVRGGPLMGRHYPMREAGVLGYGKADGGLIVLPGDNPIVTLLARPEERVILEARSICIQCRMCTEFCPRYLIGHPLRPHRVMRSVATNTEPQDLTDALLCVECGLCELFACPMGISPRQMCIMVKGQLRAAGVGLTTHESHPEQTADRPWRRVAQSRFIERLGLGGYPTLVEDLVSVNPYSVRIPLRHGVGRPAVPVVAAGEAVTTGQVIATVGRDDVGCLVHASIAGRVTEVTPDHISIEGT